MRRERSRVSASRSASPPPELFPVLHPDLQIVQQPSRDLDCDTRLRLMLAQLPVQDEDQHLHVLQAHPRRGQTLPDLHRPRSGGRGCRPQEVQGAAVGTRENLETVGVEIEGLAHCGHHPSAAAEIVPTMPTGTIAQPAKTIHARQSRKEKSSRLRPSKHPSKPTRIGHGHAKKITNTHIWN